MSNEIIGAKRVWVEILGDLTLGIIWDWIYFMRHAGAIPGWIAKSDQELAEELWVSTYQIRKAREILVDLGWVKTKLRRWAGAPTHHYQVQEELVNKVLAVYQLYQSGNDQVSLILSKRKMDLTKSHNGIGEIAKSLTALTASLDLNMINKGGQSDFSDLETAEELADQVPERSEIFKVYEQEIGPLTPMIAGSLGSLLDDYPEEWIIEGIKLSSQYNKRSLKYVEAILKNWERDGRGANIDSESGEPERMSLAEFSKLSNYQEEESNVP